MWGFTRCSTIANCERYYYYYYFKKKIFKFSFLQTKINKITFPTFQPKFSFSNKSSKSSLTRQTNSTTRVFVCISAFVMTKQEKSPFPFTNYTHIMGNMVLALHQRKSPISTGNRSAQYWRGFFFPLGTQNMAGVLPTLIVFHAKIPKFPKLHAGKKKDENTNKCKG